VELAHCAGRRRLAVFPGAITGQARANRKWPGRFRVDPQVLPWPDRLPGNAPKLNPSRYTPEFVHDRLAKGFGMPAWKEQYPE
jgi:hypothetical protein